MKLSGLGHALTALIFVPGVPILCLVWAAFIVSQDVVPLTIFFFVMLPSLLVCRIAVETAWLEWREFIDMQEEERMFYEDSEIPWGGDTDELDDLSSVLDWNPDLERESSRDTLSVPDYLEYYDDPSHPGL